MPRKSYFSDINPLKREKRAGKQDDWNRQQRKTNFEIPEWTKEFQGADWIATPNPEALAPKKQRKARIVLGCILVSLPFSFLSCMFSLGAFTASGNTPEPVVDTTPDVSPEQYRTRAVAEIEARRWLKASNLQFTALAWQDHRDASIGGCYTDNEENAAGQIVLVPKPCEIHTFFGAIDHEQAIRVEITINPATNYVVGHYVDSMPLPVQWLPAERQQARESDDILAVLPDGFIPKITEFIQAWTYNDQDALRLIANEQTITRDGSEVAEEVDQDALGLQGWRIKGTAGSNAATAGSSTAADIDASEGSAEDAAPLDVIQFIKARTTPDDFAGNQYLTTVAFGLVQECVEESEVNNLSIPTTGDETDADALFTPPSCKSCVTITPLEQAEQRGTCDGQLDITLDLVVNVENQAVDVIRSGPAGYFDEERFYTTLGAEINAQG